MHIEKKPTSSSKEYPPGSFVGKLRERKIIATLVAFAGGGVVIIELAHHILVNHYNFPPQIVDICIVTLTGPLIGTLIWRWFRGAEKRPGNVKVEVLVVPLIILLTLVIDLKLIFIMTGISINILFIGIVSLCLGIAWVVFKSLQWAASAPVEEKEEAKKLKPVEAKQKADLMSFSEWKKSIVVLPFENLSPEEGQDYFCDGMTEEIITDLSKIHSIRVISRSSAMTLKETKRKAREIAEELNVQYVLEGSVRKAGNNLRISAQLIDAVNDSHEWAEKYSGTLEDVFEIQEKVSRSIVEALKVKLETGEEKRLAERPTDNVYAYECYLRANHEMMRFTQDSLDRARHYLQKGLDLVGYNALLYAALGKVYYFYYDCGFSIDFDPFKKAQELSKKAIELDASLASSHFLLGLLERGKGNLTRAVAHIKRAVEIDPNDPTHLFMYAWVSTTYMGKANEMRPYIEKLIQIDPFTLGNSLVIGLASWMEGDIESAIGTLEKAVKTDPGFRWAHFWLANILARNQKYDRLKNIVNSLREADSTDIVAEWLMFFWHAVQRNKEKALELLTDTVRTFTWNDPEGIWIMAGLFSMIDEKNQALDWLERAVKRGWINYPLFAEQDPFLQNIRSEPRFKKLMERVKHEWENFEV